MDAESSTSPTSGGVGGGGVDRCAGWKRLGPPRGYGGGKRVVPTRVFFRRAWTGPRCAEALGVGAALGKGRVVRERGVRFVRGAVGAPAQVAAWN